jgi:hypothetical protein
MICHYSPFFNAAFNSTMIEGQTQSMELDDIEADTFGLFVNWLYTQKIERADDTNLTAEELGKLWILGQRFIIPQLQNKAMSILCQQGAIFVDGSLINFCRLAFKAAERTPLQRFSLKELVCFACVRRGNKHLVGNLMNTCLSIGPDMAKEFATALVEQGVLGGIAKWPGSDGDDLADYMVPEGE